MLKMLLIKLKILNYISNIFIPCICFFLCPKIKTKNWHNDLYKNHRRFQGKFHSKSCQKYILFEQKNRKDYIVYIEIF